MSATTFFLMGCWNRLDCESLTNKEKEPRDQVLSYILSYLNKFEDNPKPMGIIAGDNYYHVKKKFKKSKQIFKIFRESTFQYLECFINQLTSQTELHVVPGNHDYPSSKPGMEKSKSVYQRQKALHEDGYHWENQPTSVQTKGQMTFLFIDLYDEDLEKHLNGLKSQITTAIGGGQWIVYVAHEPIIAFVGKKKGKRYALMDNGKIRDFILKFIKETGSSKHLFLCADTHNFQITEIQVSDLHLTTVVAGTGGGDPDIPEPDLITESTFEDKETKQTYQVTTQALHNPYGFCVLEQDGNQIKVTYKGLERTSSYSLQYSEKRKQVEFSPLEDQEHNPKLDFTETECYRNIQEREAQFCQKNKPENFSENNSNLSAQGGGSRKKTHKKSRKNSRKKRRSQKKQKN